jgi:pimeloyl-ACP methyl ester carboxylesterase/quercetin dioxygenase-like cupin family protein
MKRLAEALAEGGYASLRFDRVGYGQSKRLDGWKGTYHDEAGVAAAAIQFARGRSEISRVVAAGESAGAYLACLAAKDGTPADAYLFLGGLCSPAVEMYEYNFGRLVKYVEVSPEHAAWAKENDLRRDLALGRRYPAMFAAAGEGKVDYEVVDGDSRWKLGLARRKEELDCPPDQMFRHIKAPALALAGEKDLNVPPTHAARAAQIMRAAGNTNALSVLVPGADHSFQQASADADVAFRERYTFASFKRPYEPGTYRLILSWLQSVVPSPATSDEASAQAPVPGLNQRALTGPEVDPKTPSTPRRVQLAPGIEIIEDITDAGQTVGVETLEGRIGPLLLAEACQAHFIDMPTGMYLEEHPHSSESIIYTVRGHWVLCSQGRRHLMKPGSLFRFGANISTGYEVPFPRMPTF